MPGHYHINATEAQVYERTKHKDSAGMVPRKRFLAAFREMRG